jgi:Kdo2-lipid IVA lauroyltransferase/acyltransferase
MSIEITEGPPPNPIAVMLVRLLLFGLASLPLGLSQWLGRRLGHSLVWFKTRAAKVTAINLRACGMFSAEVKPDHLVKSSLQHMGQTIMETPAIWLGSRRRIDRWINKVEGESLLDEALALSKGVVVLLPHFGNWELLNVFFARRQPMTALYQPPEKAYLRPVMAAVRKNFGNEMVPTNRAGVAQLYRRLQEGRVVTILPDQVPSSGEFVPFFGRPAFTDRLLSRLIRKTGARVVTCVVIREPAGQGFTIRFGLPDAQVYADDPLQSMLGVNKSIEQCVRIDPDQYQWEYKRFRRYPEGSVPLY